MATAIPAQWFDMPMTRSLLLLFFLFLVSSPSAQAQHAMMRTADRIRIAEAFRLADALQNEIWDGWDAAPFIRGLSPVGIAGFRRRLGGEG